MKKIIILLLLFTSATVYSQQTHEINFRIIDSVVIKKEYPYATKINLEINVSDFQNTVFLYWFPSCVDATDRLGYDDLSVFESDKGDDKEIAMIFQLTNTLHLFTLHP